MLAGGMGGNYRKPKKLRIELQRRVKKPLDSGVWPEPPPADAGARVGPAEELSPSPKTRVWPEPSVQAPPEAADVTAESEGASAKKSLGERMASWVGRTKKEQA